jgi:hypothetical protein
VSGQRAVQVQISPHPLGRDVLGFAADKSPDFIALNPLAAEIAKGFVLIFRARPTKINQELLNGRPIVPFQQFNF